MSNYFLAATVDPETQGFSSERYLIEAGQVTNYARQVPSVSLNLDSKNDARPSSPGSKI